MKGCICHLVKWQIHPFMLIIEHQSNPTNAYYVICKCHYVTKTLAARVQQFKW